MKLVIFLALVILLVFILLAISGNKSIEEDKENAKCLTVENYLLIRDSSVADELSQYAIHRKDDKLKFTRKGKGYTLFYLKLEEGKKVKLVGLDGYGMRDKEFLKYVCNLIENIKTN